MTIIVFIMPDESVNTTIPLGLFIPQPARTGHWLAFILFVASGCTSKTCHASLDRMTFRLMDAREGSTIIDGRANCDSCRHLVA